MGLTRLFRIHCCQTVGSCWSFRWGTLVYFLKILTIYKVVHWLALLPRAVSKFKRVLLKDTEVTVPKFSVYIALLLCEIYTKIWIRKRSNTRSPHLVPELCFSAIGATICLQVCDSVALENLCHRAGVTACLCMFMHDTCGEKLCVQSPQWYFRSSVNTLTQKIRSWDSLCLFTIMKSHSYWPNCLRMNMYLWLNSMTSRDNYKCH